MTVCVVGLGYVGSVAAAGLAAAGHNVIGVDLDRSKINTYRQGKAPIYEPGLAELIGPALQRKDLHFYHPSEAPDHLGDIIMIATGTPPSFTGAPDLSQVHSALEWVKEKQPGGGVIVMKSTVPPGTGVRLLDTMLSGTGFEYVSNPEFLREGQAVSDWFHPDRIVIGGGQTQAIEAVKALYQGIDAPYIVTNITSAEMIKYTANAFLATKISFINEIAELCDRLGATIDAVSAGISLDPRIGGSFLQAGVGYGGSCFPKDVRALDYFALSNGHNFELLRSVITVNNRQRLLPLLALRECFGRLSGVEVGVLGLAFKPNTDDVREAPALDLIRALLDEGARVRAYDPRATSSARGLVPETVQLFTDIGACLKGMPALVLMTEWPEIITANWKQISSLMRPPRFAFDGRNVLDPETMNTLGFQYRGVGRGAGPAMVKSLGKTEAA